MTKRALGNICRVLIAHILSLDEIAPLLKVAQGMSEKLLHADVSTEFFLLTSIAKDHFVVKNGFRRLYGTWLPRPTEVLYGIGHLHMDSDNKPFDDHSALLHKPNCAEGIY
ncbi:unnamed protein product [Albugo candida]|uniref:Uncharacterized protein n=1 Tax=Albugo candida TaxID=65357 RepID=A0A024G8F3_9STRA|nr:unnamed protein product [Albugo candida]|eukprot:CCI43156.1 unnamed protein product [Albugo candida]